MKHERIISGKLYRHTPTGMLGRASLVSNFVDGSSRVLLCRELPSGTVVNAWVWGIDLSPATPFEIRMVMEEMPKRTTPNIPEVPPPPSSSGPEKERWEQQGDSLAFPRQIDFTPEGDWISSGAPGMTLRDWFAGMVISGLMPQAMFHPADDNPFDRYASLAYTAADAMLQTRQKKMED